MPKVVHFEFYSPQPEATRAFFQQVFDWKIDKWDNPNMEYWMMDTGPREQTGIGGGMMKSPDGRPQSVCVIDVPDIDEYLRKIESAGGSVAMPKMAIPTVGWIAYGLDPQGVFFGIYKQDESAK